jgi:membrane protein DedA with SNARE-associated domain
MNTILQFILKHGYSFLFMALFAHQIGLPLPGPMFLLAGGALAANGKLSFIAVVVLTIVACISADMVWYEAGRRRGDKVLHFMHRFTRDPDFHDRRAKRIFARYGLPLLLVSKFVPGLDAVAPPLAGTSRTSRVRFLIFDATGAGIYACVYGGLGYAFSHDLDRAAAYVSRVGTLLLCLAFVAICVCFIIPKLVQRHALVRESRFAQITPTDPIPSAGPVNVHGGILGGQENGD